MNYIDVYSFPELELLLISKDINILPVFVIKENPDNNILIFLYYIVEVDANSKLRVVKTYSENDFNEIIQNKDLEKKIFEKISDVITETNFDSEKFHYSIHSYKVDSKLDLLLVLFKPMHMLEVLKEIYSINGIIFNIIRDRKTIPIFEKTFYFDSGLNIVFLNNQIDIEQKRKTKLVAIKKVVKDKRFSKPFLRTYYVNINKLFKKKRKISKEELSNILQKQNDVIVNLTNNFIQKWIDNAFEGKVKVVKSTEKKNLKGSKNTNTVNMNFDVIGKNVYKDFINAKITHSGNISENGNVKVSKNNIKISFENNDVLTDKVFSEIGNKLGENVDLNKVVDVISDILKKRKKEIELNIDYILSSEKIDLFDFFKVNISKIIGSKEIPYVELMINLLKEIKHSEKIGNMILSSDMSKDKINKEVRKFMNFLKVSKYNLYKEMMHVKYTFKKKEDLKEVYKKIKKFVISLAREKFITKEEKELITAILKRVFKYYEVLLTNVHPIQYVLDNISPLSVFYGEKLIGFWFSTPVGGMESGSMEIESEDDEEKVKDMYRKILLVGNSIDKLYDTILRGRKVINGIIM